MGAMVVTGAGLTVSVALPVFPSLIAMICTDPGLTEVTSPVEDTVAIALLPELHAMERPVKMLPLPSRVVALACVVCPTVIVVGASETGDDRHWYWQYRNRGCPRLSLARRSDRSAAECNGRDDAARRDGGDRWLARRPRDGSPAQDVAGASLVSAASWKIRRYDDVCRRGTHDHSCDGRYYRKRSTPSLTAARCSDLRRACS